MKVREALEVLSRVDPDADVFVAYDWFGCIGEPTIAQINSEPAGIYFCASSANAKFHLGLIDDDPCPEEFRLSGTILWGAAE